jgi:hypothetical protein
MNAHSFGDITITKVRSFDIKWKGGYVHISNCALAIVACILCCGAVAVVKSVPFVANIIASAAPFAGKTTKCTIL